MIILIFFFFNDTATTEFYSLPLHDALPILRSAGPPVRLTALLLLSACQPAARRLLLLDLALSRSEEHTSELQSPCNIVCRLLLEKKKIIVTIYFILVV